MNDFIWQAVARAVSTPGQLLKFFLKILVLIAGFVLAGAMW